MTAEVLERFSQPITTALELVAALAWNTAIQQLFDDVFGRAGGELAAEFFYAVLVTFAVIFFVTIAVGRAAERAKKAEEERGGLFGRPEDRGRGKV